MPEGDTVHKLADCMRPHLVGQTLVMARAATGRLPLVCRQPIVAVGVKGKHLFIEWPSLLLRVHLGLYGSWHVYRPQERWQRQAWQMSLVLQTPMHVFVCFNAFAVELSTDPTYRQRWADRLGPDLCTADNPLAVIMTRLQVLQRTQQLPFLLVDALLDQRPAAGIGNIYKSELMFLQRLSPRLPSAAVTTAQWHACYTNAQRLLRQNLGGSPRTTTYDPQHQWRHRQPRLYTYGRAGAPCLLCGTAVVRAYLGARPRLTFWCPSCQQTPLPCKL